MISEETRYCEACGAELVRKLSRKVRHAGRDVLEDAYTFRRRRFCDRRCARRTDRGGHKTCTQCGEEKPLDAFYVNVDVRTGRSYPRAACKDCTATQRATERQEQPERYRGYDRRSWRRDLAASRARSRRRHARNRVRENEARRRYRNVNAARLAAQRRTEKHRAQARADQRRRRVGRDREAVAYSLVLAGDPCSYCGRESTAVDHIEAVSIGGPNIWTNLTAACKPCNSRKRTRPLLVALLELPA